MGWCHIIMSMDEVARGPDLGSLDEGRGMTCRDWTCACPLQAAVVAVAGVAAAVSTLELVCRRWRWWWPALPWVARGDSVRAPTRNPSAVPQREPETRTAALTRNPQP
eukprot:1195233-Prorocentrum_minimum.AAC.3